MAYTTFTSVRLILIDFPECVYTVFASRRPVVGTIRYDIHPEYRDRNDRGLPAVRSSERRTAVFFILAASEFARFMRLMLTGKHESVPFVH